MKPIYKKIFSFLFILLILFDPKVSGLQLLKLQKRGNLISDNLKERNPHQDSTKEKKPIKNVEPSVEKSSEPITGFRSNAFFLGDHSHRFGKANAHLLPILPFFILSSTMNSIKQMSQTFTKQLKAQIQSIRAQSKRNIEGFQNDVDEMMDNNCLFYKYLRFTSYNFLNMINFQMTIFNIKGGRN